MADAFHDLQFDSFLPHQSQIPALGFLWLLSTQQRHQVGFGFSVQFAFLGPRRLGTAKECRIQSLLSHESADPLHGTSAHVKGFHNLRGGPSWPLGTTIHFEQDLSMLQGPGQCLSFAEDLLYTLTLSWGVVLQRWWCYGKLCFYSRRAEEFLS